VLAQDRLSQRPRPRILILLHSVQGGGAEVAMTNLSEVLDNSYHLKKFGIFGEKSQKNGITRDFSRLRFVNRIQRASIFLQSGLRFRKEMREFSPTLVIINCEAAELLYSLFAGRGRGIAITHVSKKGFWINHRAIAKFVEKILVIRKVERRYVSEGLTDDYGVNKEYALPNIQNFDRFTHLTFKNHFVEPRLVFVGRLHQQKQPQEVLQISNILNTKAVFFGDGPLLPDLLKFKQDLNADAEFIPFTERVWSEVSKNDILVLPSSYEGKPLVIDEAVFMGLRVATYALPYLTLEYKNLPVYFAKSFYDLVGLISNLLKMPSLTAKEVRLHRDILIEKNIVAINKWQVFLKETYD
jgi:hypothetical protein